MRVIVKLTFCLEVERMIRVQGGTRGGLAGQSKGREGGTLPEVVAVEVQPLELYVGVAVEQRHVGSSPLNHCKGGRKEGRHEVHPQVLHCHRIEIRDIHFVPLKGPVSVTEGK